MSRNETIQYYNTNAEHFTKDTVAVAFTEVQERFTSYLQEGGYILDFGCGSGRDSLAFLQRGFQVDALDGSNELCQIASQLTGKEVKCQDFLALEEREKYDGIWACASILHLPKNELTVVMKKLEDALKPGGYLYMSFKYGDFEGVRDGRYFTNLTEESFQKMLITSTNYLTIVDIRTGGDCRPGREQEMWLNVIVKKGEK